MDGHTACVWLGATGPVCFARFPASGGRIAALLAPLGSFLAGRYRLSVTVRRKPALNLPSSHSGWAPLHPEFSKLNPPAGAGFGLTAGCPILFCIVGASATVSLKMPAAPRPQATWGPITCLAASRLTSPSFGRLPLGGWCCDYPNVRCVRWPWQEAAYQTSIQHQSGLPAAPQSLRSGALDTGCLGLPIYQTLST